LALVTQNVIFVNGNLWFKGWVCKTVEILAWDAALILGQEILEILDFWGDEIATAVLFF
jgi:hypothetical protein